MKQLLFSLTIFFALTGTSLAQQRHIARGAAEGELYMNVTWYANCSFWGDTLYAAMLHITENGKKVKINHSMQCQSPDALTGDALPMQIGYSMADATPGVLYNADWFMAYADDNQPYIYDRLWFSNDYGKTWELRDKPEYRSYYYAANVEGVIYRGQEGVEILKSTDYGATFLLVDGMCWTHCEFGWQEEVFMIGAFSGYDLKLFHTYDLFQTYTEIPVDSQFMFGQGSGPFPDVFRGGKQGEVYITSWFPDNTYKVSFSADTGYHFRVVYHSNPQTYEIHLQFMSDRKAGDFYIVTQQMVETQQPWGWYRRIYIAHYTDYGATLVGTYCHDLTREGVVAAVKEREEESEVVVYPNPTSGALHVTSDALHVTDVEVFDVYGKRHALRVTSNEMTIDISDLQSGIYFVKIATEKGVVTKKVIKK